jgi:hypothetical protein
LIKLDVQVPGVLVQLSVVQANPSSQLALLQHTLLWPLRPQKPLPQSTSIAQDCPGALLQLPVLEQTYPDPVSQSAAWVQEVVHAAAPDFDVQMYPGAQATGLGHCPFPPHVCRPLPEHCLSPGAHLPVHAPPTHAWLLHGTAVPQPPVVVQVCTPLLEHCT